MDQTIDREDLISETEAVMDELEPLLKGRPNDVVFAAALTLAESCVDYSIPATAEYASAALRRMADMIDEGGMNDDDEDTSTGRTLQ
jgi:hypothetical protein